MANITLRANKGSELTFSEADSNFSNLNTDKLEKTGGTITGYTEGVHELGTVDSPSVDPQNGNIQRVTSDALNLPDWATQAGQTITFVVTGTGTASGTTNYVWFGGNKDYEGQSLITVLYDGYDYYAAIAKGFV